MKFFLLILIGLLGHIENAYSQTDTKKNNVFGGFIIMPIEFPVIDTKEINQQLTANYSTAIIGIGFQLFTNKYFSWTGTTSLGSYSVSATSSHYDWAMKKIKKHKKELTGK